MARKKKQAEGAGLGGGDTSRARLTPIDVQQKTFRQAFKGYNEDDVDEFLDQVTEDLAALYEENKRLRELVEERGGGGLEPFEEAERRAEETVRQAREHAARLVAEAERRAEAAGAPSQVVSPGWYLSRERDFLQRLATLVQEHAETLKHEARRGREEAAEIGGDQGAAAPTPVARPAPENAGEGEGRPEQEIPATQQDESPPLSGQGPEVAEPSQQPLLEATGAMSAVESDEDDLLAEWDNPFVEGRPARASDGSSRPGDGSAPSRRPGLERGKPVERPTRPTGPDEPSLRELFWGEE